MTEFSGNPTGPDCSKGLEERLHAAWKALRIRLEALPLSLPQDDERIGSYAVCLGEALACHDEMRVLRALAAQRGLPPLISRMEEEALARHGKTLLFAVKLFFASPQVRSGAWADLARFAPRDTGGNKNSRLTASLKKEETALKASYLRLLPASSSKDAGASKKQRLGVVPRQERKREWLVENAAWLERAPALETVFSALLDTRQRLARAQGFDNYAGLLAFRRGDTGWIAPDFLRQAAESALPLIESLQEQRRDALGLTSLRPYDTNAQRLYGSWNGQPVEYGLERLLRKVEPLFSGCFAVISREALLLDTGPPLCMHLQHSRRPLVQTGGEAGPKGLMATLHELGHAIHILLSSGQANPFYRVISPLSGELAAMGVELLAARHLEELFTDERLAAWCMRKKLEAALAVFPTARAMEEFERKLYTRKTSQAERGHLFAEIFARQAGLIDYAGYEHILESWYLRVPILVLSPGYFFNYAVAQAGALSVFMEAEKNGRVPENFKNFLHLGASLPDGELYASAGALPCGYGMAHNLGFLGKKILELRHIAPLA